MEGIWESGKNLAQGNLPGIYTDDPAKAPSSSRYVAGTAHLLCPVWCRDQLSSERLDSSTDKKDADSQPDMRQSLGNPTQERAKDYRSQKGQRYLKRAHRIN